MNREKLTDKLHHAAEQIMLKCMILNRRGIAQAHISYHAHVNELDVAIWPVDTDWREGAPRPESLGKLRVHLDIIDYLDDRSAREQYNTAMQRIRLAARWLDYLIEQGQPIMADTGAAA